MARISLLAVAACMVILGSGGRAEASELSVGTTCDKYMDCSHVATYAADRGERNDVRVVRVESTLSIFDPGSAIRAPSGCAGAGTHAVTCTLDLPLARIRVSAADGDDRIDASALTNGTRAILDGGAGNDTLIGGPFQDTLSGGAGNDGLDGAGGTDTASFADHKGGMRVDLHARTATTARGERDTLADVEDVRGGPGDDTISGDGATNQLTGGGGADDLRGRGGPDVLFGSGTLDGGAGDDRLRLLDRGYVRCGAGAADLVAASGKAATVDDSCERLRLPGLTVGLHLTEPNPALDAITIPVIDLPIGTLLDSRLTIGAKPTTLGRIHRTIRCQFHCVHPRLRFSDSGAARVRRDVPATIAFSLKTSLARTLGGTVQLRINRH
ncbi:MAG: hypothetical protein QOJ35_4191 [Solirubrobacteraceae bacterium]|jgi:hypothetical protein|nr:hypothetical protein [Solirubrobacteraceae bacterium]